MRLDEVDWSVVRGSLIVLALCLLVSGALVAGSQYLGAKAESAYAKARAQLLGVRGRYQTVDQEEEIIARYLPRYRELEAQGVIGRERRLDWVETLRQAAEELRLPGLRYAIDTQTEFRADYPLETGAFHVYVSEMGLDLGLLHEEDLPALLELLDERARGLYSVADCVLRRAGERFGQDPRESNVNARCALRWLTVRQPEAGRGSG